MLIAQQDTAVAAYRERVQHFAPSQAERIAAYVAMVGGATIGEIAQALRLDKSTVSGRQKELRDGRILMFAGERKCRVSGITCNVLRMYCAEQADLFAAQEAA